MPVNRCRVCGNLFFEKPLIVLKNMPKSAQYLPAKDDIADDRGIDLEVYQCSGCGLVQLGNDPVPYYKEVIRATGFSESMKQFRFKQFQDFIEKYSLKGKKIIEIGCGKGEYLSLMVQLGVDAYGLEASEESVSACKKQGLKVIRGFIESENYQIENAPFDAFFMMSFLEHIPYPNKVLRGIFNNLKEDAVGIVEVPNFNMILRKNLFSEFISDHLMYFTKDTLIISLNLNGFEVIEFSEIWHDYIISAVVQRKKPIALSHFNNYLLSLKEELNKFLGKYKNKKVAVWGAGHQALAVLSLTEISNKIKYVVDSATFKQGKYTPATHIPIVSPETIESEPIDAIIVMAGSYSDEVVNLVKGKYGVKIDLAVLRDTNLEVIK
ncbi:methyltransferase domain-containing protein [Thermodesulfovibrio hydrogeniphilus]